MARRFSGNPSELLQHPSHCALESDIHPAEDRVRTLLPSTGESWHGGERNTGFSAAQTVPLGIDDGDSFNLDHEIGAGEAGYADGGAGWGDDAKIAHSRTTSSTFLPCFYGCHLAPVLEPDEPDAASLPREAALCPAQLKSGGDSGSQVKGQAPCASSVVISRPTASAPWRWCRRAGGQAAAGRCPATAADTLGRRQ
jgi:hypothetical protein